MLTPDLGRRASALGSAATSKVVHKKGDYDGLLELLPATVDWVSIGAVSEKVDDQGMVRPPPLAPPSADVHPRTPAR
jgi:hypothetical protein